MPQSLKLIYIFCSLIQNTKDIPGDAIVEKISPAHVREVRDKVSIPGLGRPPGGGPGNPIQYSCLENSMDRGA